MEGGRASVCVLLSTYNGEGFLEAQLDSLRRQAGVEVLLHARDDGSSDGTLDILRRHVDAWPALARLEAGSNLGPARSFLELLRTAPDADYYAFCDQDDIWLPDKLARAVAALSMDAGPALYCSNVTCVAENLRVLGVPPENGDASFQHLLFENIAYGCTTVMNLAARASIIERLPERGLVMHDWWCALVVAAFGIIRYDPEPRILYRQHGGNSIGVEASALFQTIAMARKFLRDPKAFYPIRPQAQEILRLYGPFMSSDLRDALVKLVQSQNSFASRTRYALSSAVVRARILDCVAARGLLLLG